MSGENQGPRSCKDRQLEGQTIMMGWCYSVQEGRNDDNNDQL